MCISEYIVWFTGKCLLPTYSMHMAHSENEGSIWNRQRNSSYRGRQRTEKMPATLSTDLDPCRTGKAEATSRHCRNSKSDEHPLYYTYVALISIPVYFMLFTVVVFFCTQHSQLYHRFRNASTWTVICVRWNLIAAALPFELFEGMGELCFEGALQKVG